MNDQITPEMKAAIKALSPEQRKIATEMGMTNEKLGRFALSAAQDLEDAKEAQRDGKALTHGQVVALRIAATGGGRGTLGAPQRLAPGR